MNKIRETVMLPHEATLDTIDDLAERIRQAITEPERYALVGIRSGGAVVARHLRRRLAEKLGVKLPMGYLDITFYRDDLDTIGPNPVLEATELDFDIDGKRILLVDDVIFSGRTIRAALNALFDFGRPELVRLVVLVDRGHRQLPIQPDFSGLTVETTFRESIKLRTEQETLQVIRRSGEGRDGE